MSESLFSLEFFLPDAEESFANCVTSCVPRIGEKVSLYEVTHQGHHDYRVMDVEYQFDVRTSDDLQGRNPQHWGLQPVAVHVQKIVPKDESSGPAEFILVH